MTRKNLPSGTGKPIGRSRTTTESSRGRWGRQTKLGIGGIKCQNDQNGNAAQHIDLYCAVSICSASPLYLLDLAFLAISAPSIKDGRQLINKVSLFLNVIYLFLYISFSLIFTTLFYQFCLFKKKYLIEKG